MTNQEAIGIIKNAIAEVEWDYPMDYAAAFDMAVKALGNSWISVEEALPKDGEKSVLAVKQLKDGRRDICIARCIPDYELYDPDTKQHVRSPYWVCGGNNNIIYWMPLPDMPKER